MTTTADALLAADAEARQDALDVARSFIVQAPAGSGKTELLIQRYLALLATVTEPEQVLAITFTRKAAAEMRLRVVDALQMARSGGLPDEAHRRITIEAAGRVLDRDGALSWGLLENAARLRIQTLDSLNASIARMLPVTASGGGATIVEDAGMDRLYRQAAAATLEWLGASDAVGVAARTVLEHLDANTGVYVAQLSAMLKNRDQWLPFVGSGDLSDADADELRRAIEAQLGSIVSGALAATAAALPADDAAELAELAALAAANLDASGRGQRAICGFGFDPEIPRAVLDDLVRWQAIADLLLTGSDTLRKRVDVGVGFPPADKDAKGRMSALLARLADAPEFVAALAGLRQLPPVRYADEQWAVLRQMFRLLPVAIFEWRRLCVARGETDHVEIALAAAAALGTADAPGDIALLLDHEVRHILVDEMQDTSKAQYRMLEALTGGWEQGDGRTLFCVGDPMQSIYRFRNAEVTQFLHARRRGIGSIGLQPLLLRQNFRSGERLVEWFNQVFPEILPPTDDPLFGAISYAPCVAAPTLRGRGACAVHPVFGNDRETEAVAGAALVNKLHREHPDDSIAILVSSRTRLPALLQSLRESSIPYQAVEIDRLTDLPEVIDVLALTRALAHEDDRIAWLGVLRGPGIGLDWTDLHALVAGADRRTVPELWRDAERLTSLSATGRAAITAALPALDRALRPDRSARLRERVERLWFELGGPALLRNRNEVDNVYRFLDAISSLETGGTLQDVAELEEMLDGVRASTSSPARVQVMTMHKAKGLQFDHVVLFGLGRKSANDESRILSWLDVPDEAGGGGRLISPIGRRDEIERDQLHQFIARLAKAKDDHESGRLLYVACTRAKQSLHLVGHVALKDGGDSYAAPPAGTLLQRLWPAVAPDFEQAFLERPDTGIEAEAPVFAQPPFRRLAVPWQLPAPSALVVARPAPDAPAALPVEFDWVGFDARLAGTLVHRWLQRYADGRANPAGGLPADLERRTRRWLQELGAAEAMHASILPRVTSALAKMLGDTRGRWLLEGRGDAELALTGRIDGRLESIVIDRVRIDDDGTHWLVDYKTSVHEGGNLDGFIASEVRRYRPQIEKYASIYAAYSGREPRCALYFPLLARFVEVDSGSGRPDVS